MQRSSSFSRLDNKNNGSKIPTPLHRNSVPERPTSLLRRTSSLRLPSSSSSSRLKSPGEREIWGIGSGSWGKRQQQLRKHSTPVSGERTRSCSVTTSPLSPPPRGLFVDKIHGIDDLLLDDDACSERSYDSTMSVDRAALRTKHRYTLHCNNTSEITNNINGGDKYLTPTQRTVLANKELKARLRQALDDIANRDREISRLTQECVELRMNQVRIRSRTTSPSTTPSYVEKDSLNSSIHSNLEVPANSEPVIILNQQDCINKKSPVFDFKLPIKSLQDCSTQTDHNMMDILEKQLNAANEALVETKERTGVKRWSVKLLNLNEALLLWQQALLKVELSRARNAANASHAEVTLQFLKSAFYHLITDSGQVTQTATRSHWRAIQSILGFNTDECKAMDNALINGTFPSGMW